MRSLTHDGFGSYTLHVQNEARKSFVQHFTVISQKAPQTPVDVDIIYQYSNTSAVTIKWMPGHNGGALQTFHLQYKAVSVKDWAETLLPEDTIYLWRVNYTITGLSVGTKYIVQLFARNVKGDSDTTRAIEFVTENAECPVTCSCPEMSYAGIAGGTTAAVLLIIILIGVVRTRYNIAPKGHDEEKPAAATDALPDGTLYDELSPDRQTGAGAYDTIQRDDEGHTRCLNRVCPCRW